MKHTAFVVTAIALLVGLVAMAVQPQSAPDLAGTWQGTLQVGGGLRLVFQISKGNDGELKAVLHSIDQPAAPVIPVTKVTVQGLNVDLSIAAIGGGFNGKLTADGNTIAGNWSQAGNSIPLSLVRATPQSAWTIPEAAPALKPMPRDASPSFDAASIKPSDPTSQGKGIGVRLRTLSTANTSVSDLMAYAYGVHPRQIVGGPAWLESDRFDITGKPDLDGAPSQDQWKGMLQKLLALRFGLTFHRDRKELSVYAIAVDKSGSKLTASAGAPNGLPGLGMQRLGFLAATNATMPDLASFFQTVVLDRPVVDQSGLNGHFDFTLKWTPDETQFTSLGMRAPTPTDPTDAPPDLFAAMQEQLGLQIKATKTSVEVLVIDHVSKPSN